jgi:hypothetical protein
MLGIYTGFTLKPMQAPRRTKLLSDFKGKNWEICPKKKNAE